MERPRSGSDRAAELLEGEPELDEITRARMEKNLLAAVKAGEHLALDDEPAEQSRKDTALGRPGVVAVAGLAIVAAAAVALVVYSPDDGGDEPEVVATESATFLRYRAGETTERGELVAGRRLSTEDGERVEVRMGAARVDVTPGSAIRFVQLDMDHVEVELDRGAVEVELHPARRGDQTLRVVTQRAFVDVVGTVFRVAVDDGETLVSTVEGTVRVTPRDGSEARLVHAGQQTRVGETTRSEAEAETVSADHFDEPLSGERPRSGAQREGSSPTASASAPTSETGSEPPRAPTIQDRFAVAEARLDAGDHVACRRILSEIANTRTRAAHRVRAYTLIAESYAAQQRYRDAADSYGEAVDAGGHSVGAQNALFAMGRLFERQMHDEAAATAAYRRYLELSPGGAHADHVHRALCRMGHEEHCQ